MIDGKTCDDHAPVRLEMQLAPGSYTFEVLPGEAVDALDFFDLEVTETDRQLESEPNDQLAKATAFDGVNPVYGKLADDSDVDIYTFDVETPRYL